MRLSLSTLVISKLGLIVAASRGAFGPCPRTSVRVSLPTLNLSFWPFPVSSCTCCKIVDTLTVVISACGRKMNTATRMTITAIRSQKTLVLSHFPLVDIEAPLYSSGKYQVAIFAGNIVHKCCLEIVYIFSVLYYSTLSILCRDVPAPVPTPSAPPLQR